MLALFCLDFKPSNVMRHQNRLKLIDMDASAMIGVGYSGAKISSAFIPPEMIYRNLDSDEIGVKSFTTKNTGKLEWDDSKYQLITASASFDAWSLGATLFHLYSGYPLFIADSGDNISHKELADLRTWSPEFLDAKLADISNSLARNLVSQLLVKDPARRINMTQVLDHPFISGKKVSRMIGETADFDVFIR